MYFARIRGFYFRNALNKFIKKFGYPIAVILIIIGIIFKLLHFQYSQFIFLIGVVVLLVTLTYRLIIKPNKELFDYALYFMVFSFILNILFALFHWPYKFILNTSFLIFLSLFFISGFFELIYKVDTDESSDEVALAKKRFKLIMVSFYSTATLLIIIGTLFKIMLWPYGNLILIFGLVIIGLIFLLDSLKRNKAE